MRTTCAGIVSLMIILNTIAVSTGYSQNINQRFQLTPYFNLKGYSWKEFSDTGNEDLSESGTLYDLGGIARYGFTKDMRLYGSADLQFYFGSVGYSGFQFNLQTGERTPYTTNVGYFGVGLDLSSGYDFKIAKSFELTPFAGFGIEYWSRDIGKGSPGGYIEKYTTFSLDLGVRGTYVMDRNSSFFSSLHLNVPVSISESVDLSSIGQPSDISLSPGINPRFHITLGGSFYSTFVELYFDTWTLSKSGEDRGFLQPESTRKNYGMRIGYTFAI